MALDINGSSYFSENGIEYLPIYMVHHIVFNFTLHGGVGF